MVTEIEMSSTETPLVSVLLPFFNAEKYIPAAVASVATQTHDNLEIIAVNDGSTDNSLQVTRAALSDTGRPFELLSQDNAGPSPALHRALDHANGEWICWLAADDWYDPDFITESLSTLNSLDADVWVLHCNTWLVEESGKITGTADDVSSQQPLAGDAFELRLSGEGRMHPSTMFIHRRLLDKAGGFDPHMHAEDIDLFLRLARVARFHYIRDPLYFCRYTPGSLGKKAWIWGEDVLSSIEKHRDILGPRMPFLRAKACENVAVSCFEHGKLDHGLMWSRRALRESKATSTSSSTFKNIVIRGIIGVLRGIAIRWVGHETLSSIKRTFARRNGLA